MIKLWFHLPWLWLERDILLLCLCVFLDPHPAGSPGTGLCGARADLSDISLAERLFGSLWIFFPFFSLGRSCSTTKALVARKEGVSGRQELGAGGWERQEFSLLPVSCCSLSGGGCPHPLLPDVHSVPAFHPDTAFHCCLVCGATPGV